MSEKRYITQKYVRCTCSKHQEVLVGMKYYKYANIMVVPLYLFFMVFFALGLEPPLLKVGVVLGMLLFIILLPLSEYIDVKNTMLKAGHSESCSKNIAKLATMHFGLWSQFKIIDKSKGSK